MKSIIKITVFLLIILLCTNTFTYGIDINPEDYKPGGLESADSDKVADITAKLLKYIQYFGIILAIVILTVIGFKFILNSAEEKAKYMESMLPYIIGCVLLISATTIPRIVALSISDGGNSGTPNPSTVTSYTCGSCGATVTVPAFVIVGGHDANCNSCGAKIIDKGTPVNVK